MAVRRWCVGLIYGLVYNGRNPAPLILTHGFSASLSLVVIYLGVAQLLYCVHHSVNTLLRVTLSVSSLSSRRTEVLSGSGIVMIMAGRVASGTATVQIGTRRPHAAKPAPRNDGAYHHPWS
jgi:hypothetical protein